MLPKRLRRSAWARLAVLALGCGLLVIGARRASGGDPEDDGVPAGTVAFFGGGDCPSGWKVSADAQGRLVVGVTDGQTANVTLGEPLTDREDREHVHTWNGKVTLTDKAIAGADGPNQSGAAAQGYDLDGKLAPATSGLAFVQVQACVKQ